MAESTLPTVEDLKKRLDEALQEYKTRHRALRAEYLGKGGLSDEIAKTMGEYPFEERAVIGLALNDFVFLVSDPVGDNLSQLSIEELRATNSMFKDFVRIVLSNRAAVLTTLTSTPK